MTQRVKITVKSAANCKNSQSAEHQAAQGRYASKRAKSPYLGIPPTAKQVFVIAASQHQAGWEHPLDWAPQPGPATRAFPPASCF